MKYSHSLFYCFWFLIFGYTATAQKSLDYFLEQSYNNSPLLKNNSIRAEANKSETERIITTLKKPLIGAELNYLLSPIYSTDNSNPGFKINPSKNISSYYGYDLSATNGGLYRGIITLDQPLFNNQRIQVVNEQLSVQNQILDNNNRLTKHDLERLVTEQYLISLQDIEQQKAIQNIIDIISGQIKTTENLAANGLALQSDYKLLNVERQQQQTLLKASKDNYKIHLLGLNSLCGISDTSVVDLIPVTIEPHTKEKNYPSGFIKQYQLDSLNLDVFKKSFDTRYKPLVSLYSSAGLNAVYAPNIYQRFGWIAGIKLTKTLFDGRQKEMNAKRIKILQQETSVNTDFFEKQNASRKALLQQQIISVETQMQSLQQQIREYDDLLNYYKNQIINGQVSVINYITILRSKANLQFNLVSLQTNRAISINNYNFWNW